MATTTSERTLLPADPASYDQLYTLLQSDPHGVYLSGSDPDSDRYALPQDLLAVLADVVRALHSGVAVVVSPRPTKLTTQQAAEILGVSRPTLVRLLESEEIPFDRPNSHRYIELRDLLSYIEKLQQHQRRFAEQMVDEAAERLGDGPDRIFETR